MTKNYINLLSLPIPYGDRWSRGTGMSPWTSAIWAIKQFEFCFLLINCRHLKNFVCSLALFFDYLLNSLLQRRQSEHAKDQCKRRHFLLCPLHTSWYFFLNLTHWLPANPSSEHTIRVETSTLPIISSHCIAIDFHKTTPLKATRYRSQTFLSSLLSSCKVNYIGQPLLVGKTDESATRFTKRTNKAECNKRHYNAASYIYWKVFQSYNIKTTETGNKCYKRKSETIVENEYVTVLILWNTPNHTDREILAYKPAATISNASL